MIKDVKVSDFRGSALKKTGRWRNYKLQIQITKQLQCPKLQTIAACQVPPVFSSYQILTLLPFFSLPIPPSPHPPIPQITLPTNLFSPSSQLLSFHSSRPAPGAKGFGVDMIELIYCLFLISGLIKAFFAVLCRWSHGGGFYIIMCAFFCWRRIFCSLAGIFL